MRIHRGGMVAVEVSSVRRLDPFEFRWPDAVEAFEGGWAYTVVINGARRKVKHGLGARVVYGRPRVHTVTWIDGEVQVEGVEADDYPVSQALLSRLRRAGRAFAMTGNRSPMAMRTSRSWITGGRSTLATAPPALP